jgi:hypothetical protein
LPTAFREPRAFLGPNHQKLLSLPRISGLAFLLNFKPKGLNFRLA